MNWQQKYLERSEGHRDSNFDFIINARRIRYKVNKPIKQEHFSELEYLLISYDVNAALLRRYEGDISEEVKSQWLERRLNRKSHFKNSFESEKIYKTLLPFYLINPQTKNPLIDKYFLGDQLMLILSGINHIYKRYRWRAHYIFEFLVPNFGKLLPGYRSRVIKLLIVNSNSQNIRLINWLVLSNVDFIELELIESFAQNQLDKNLVTPRMAIGYLKRFHSISQTNREKLRSLVLKLERGEYILGKLGLL